MNAIQWLRITWPVLLIAGLLVLAGLFVMTQAPGGGALVGLALVLFGLYWAYRGTTPARD